MSISYPPYIEGKLPAQVGNNLIIPYQLNRALGFSDIQGKTIKARLKTGSTSTLIDINLETTVTDEINLEGNYLASFALPDNHPLQKGAFYKIQLAFVAPNSTAIPTYSSVGVFKYTSEVTLEILELTSAEINELELPKLFTGVYSNDDATERIEYYKFDIYKEGLLIETSDWQIHGASVENTDSYSFVSPKPDEYYSVVYSVKTQNGLIASSPRYIIKYLMPQFTSVD